MLSVLLISATVTFTISRGKPVHLDWGYYRNPYANGPQSWTLQYPACGGNRQSPIFLPLDGDQNLRHSFGADIQLEGYNRITEVKVKNSPYTFVSTFELEDGGVPKVVPWFNRKEYCLVNGHFHWGKDDSEGSEHRVGQYYAPLEMHLVHYRCDLGSMKRAQNNPDSDTFLVLAVLFELDEHRTNVEFDRILDYFPMLTIPNQIPTGIEIRTPQPKPFDLTKLLPRNRHHFYHYDGSFTTPPCTETVQWLVFADKVKISRVQMNLIRHSAVWTGPDESTKVDQNFRPAQSLNGRSVYLYT